MVRILFFTSRLSIGGTEKAMLSIANKLDPNQFQVTILTLFGGGELENEIAKHVKYQHVLPQFIHGYARLIKPIAYIWHWVVKSQFDIEIAVGCSLECKFILAGSSRKSQKILWYHMDASSIYPNDRKIYARLASRMNHVICPSESAKSSFQRYVATEVPVTSLYNPIDVETIIQKSKAVPDDLPAKHGYIISIGRLEHGKNLPLLLECMALLVKENPAQRLLIIGDGTQRKEMEDLTKQYELEKYVTFLGQKVNPYPYLRAAGLLVSLSEYESLGLILLEAMCLGVPVLSAPNGGAKEVLGADYATVWAEGKVENIACAMKKLLDNERQDNESMAHLDSRFNLNVCLHRFENFFFQLQNVDGRLPA
ncbi:hypothetical protein AGMMS49992_16260 [Clostridia bacterium]|nr:hypothetical protein AGMMS49992_16260 [Clostridia bacterium]